MAFDIYLYRIWILYD